VYLSGTIFVADIANPDRPSGRELVGMLGIIVALHPVTGRPYADELAWWVNPAHRRGRVGPALLGRGEQWARQMGASMLKMVAPVDTDVGRYYRKHGYDAVETAYVKRL